jgi:hypothetical protein
MAAAVTENTSTAIPKAPRRTEMAPTRASGGLYHPAIITRGFLVILPMANSPVGP